MDNFGAEMLTKERKVTSSSRHITRRFLKVREYVAKDIVAVRRVAITDNPADMFTTPLDRVVFNKHASKLMHKDVANNLAGFA